MELSWLLKVTHGLMTSMMQVPVWANVALRMVFNCLGLLLS